MTNITLIVLVSTVGIVLVYGECLTDDDAPIESCCCLGYNNTHFNAKSSGVYTYMIEIMMHTVQSIVQ